MTYTKMQPEDVIKKLKDGGYKSATAARRAVGKAAFDQKGKDKCYEAINKHFGDDAKPQKQPKSKRDPKPATSGTPAGKQPFDVTEAALAEIELAQRRVGTITQALAALNAAKEASPNVDVKSGATAGAAALTDIMRGVHDSVAGKNSKDNGLSKTASAPASAPAETGPEPTAG